MVSTDFAHSGVNSAKDNGTNDCLLLLGDKTTGSYELSWWMYIEADKCGYYNMQHFQTPGLEWAFEIYFKQNGQGKLLAGTTTDTITFTYPKATWL